MGQAIQKIQGLHESISCAEEELLALSAVLASVTEETVEVIEVSAGAESEPVAGLHVVAQSGGKSNFLVLAQRTKLRFTNFRVLFKGSGNVMVVSPSVDDRGAFAGYCRFESNGGLAYLNQGQQIVTKLHVVFWSPGNILVWGNGTTSNGTTVESSGPGKRITVGADCMFAADTWVRTYDQHSIVDLTDMQPLNMPRDVCLEEHVWVGQYSAVYGARLGKGSIVGAYSLVKQDCEPFSLVAGVPARLIRKDVTWTRAPFPTTAEVAQVVARLGRGEPNG
jgi:acetyltransferase-like isoleucine patch superfamily enzyme